MRKSWGNSTNTSSIYSEAFRKENVNPFFAQTSPWRMGFDRRSSVLAASCSLSSVGHACRPALRLRSGKLGGARQKARCAYLGTSKGEWGCPAKPRKWTLFSTYRDFSAQTSSKRHEPALWSVTCDWTLLSEVVTSKGPQLVINDRQDSLLSAPGQKPMSNPPGASLIATCS